MTRFLIVLPVILTAFSSYGDSDSIVTRLDVDGSEYRSIVKVPAGISDSLLFAILTDTFHVHKYNKLTRQFHDVTDNSYDMYASFSLFPYRCETIFKRKIDRPGMIVRVSLGLFRQNIKILPQPLATSGIYRIVHENGKSFVEYKQYVKSSRRISFIYEKAIEGQIRRFGKSLHEYIGNFEGNDLEKR